MGQGGKPKTKNSKIKRRINRENKLRIVFDENARKTFLTGFKKRKDERRKKAKEEIEIRLKAEIQKIKSETKEKLEKAKKGKAHQIVPEIAHLIETNQTETAVTDFGSHSVSVTTLDSLDKLSAPWRRKEEEEDDDSEGEDNAKEDNNDEEEDEEDELPGMSLKSKAKPSASTVSSMVDPKERKQINQAAIKQLHSSKAFKAKERLIAKKQSTKARFAKGKKKLPKKRDRVHNPKKTVDK
eukprot:TRINITY_DN8060_c0_g1_i1.p1 TRINITY_DN8060_c0_g1~~TRINITY_DN8060_c0_g1_i1.p1  ORF type:complete len:247 (-),score=79.68 TRINITY_DN8060_c0_g1_i1:21-740(-)